MSSGAWNLDSDLEAGKEALANQNASNNIFSIQKARPAEDSSYTPHLVPIGPYHRNCLPLWIEKEKLRYVGFMQSLSERYKEGGLNGLVEELEPRAREWYGEGAAHMTPEELARMLLRDGCYLLGWLGNYPDAPLLFQASPNDENTVFRDILYLIENQIPFFVLERIHARATGGTSYLLQYMATYIQSLLQDQLYVGGPEEQRRMEQPCHLLHLVHTYFRPTNLLPSTDPEPPRHTGRWRRATDYCLRAMTVLHLVHTYFHPSTLPAADTTVPRRTGRWRRATEYRIQANVKFLPRDFAEEVTSVLDMRLVGGTLWIPRLQVCRDTWTLLRNLMVLEEQMSKRPVTAYCIFMSQVACTVEDVRLLVDAKILEHFEGSDDIAAQGFADLCKGVVMDVHNIDRNYLKPIWHDLEKFCCSKTRNFKASFRQKYCSSRLHRVAFVITAFLAFCQLLQATYAPIAYHFPKN